MVGKSEAMVFSTKGKITRMPFKDFERKQLGNPRSSNFLFFILLLAFIAFVVIVFLTNYQDFIEERDVLTAGDFLQCQRELGTIDYLQCTDYLIEIGKKQPSFPSYIFNKIGAIIFQVEVSLNVS